MQCSNAIHLVRRERLGVAILRAAFCALISCYRGNKSGFLRERADQLGTRLVKSLCTNCHCSDRQLRDIGHRTVVMSPLEIVYFLVSLLALRVHCSLPTEHRSGSSHHRVSRHNCFSDVSLYAELEGNATKILFVHSRLRAEIEVSPQGVRHDCNSRCVGTAASPDTTRCTSGAVAKEWPPRRAAFARCLTRLNCLRPLLAVRHGSVRVRNSRDHTPLPRHSGP